MNDALLFPIFFMFMWFIVCEVLSALGGWNLLAKKYKAIGVFEGERSQLQTVKVGVVSYRSCVTLGMNQYDLYLAVILPFRIGHHPIAIPYDEIVGREENGFIFKYVVLNICGIRVRVAKDQADKMNEESKGRWNYSGS